MKLKILFGIILFVSLFFWVKEASAYWACVGSGSAQEQNFSCVFSPANCPIWARYLCRQQNVNFTSYCGWGGGVCRRTAIISTRRCNVGSCFSSTQACWNSGDSGGTTSTTSGCSVIWVPDPSPTPGPGCNATAPTGLSVTRLTPTSSTLSWTPGANGTEQRVYIGANQTEVESNCPGTGSPACVVAQTGLPTSQTSYTVNTLSASTVYYYRVVNYKDASCSALSTTAISISSCDITTSDPVTIQAGSTANIISSANASSSISSVDFVSGNSSIASVNPTSDTTSPYQTVATGVSPGSTSVTSNVIIGGATNCSDSVNVNVTAAQAWWQVRDADITTNGDIISPIPGSCTLPACNPVLGLRGSGGFPGVPAYGGTTADFLSGAGNGSAAESPYNWLANSRYNGRVYDYAFFERQIPDDVVINELTPPVTGGTFNSGGTPSRGYVWYHWDGAALGDLSINGNVNLVGSRKVVLMVEGANVLINGRIQLQSPGQGFFMMVVGKDSNGLRGDISVDPSVDDLEGVFLAESEFRTGAASTQLQVRGSVAAYDGVILERDLGAANSNTPAELFEYAPDIIATFPSVFTQRRIRWKEVAP